VLAKLILAVSWRSRKRAIARVSGVWFAQTGQFRRAPGDLGMN
jgi:hypothetical protein